MGGMTFEWFMVILLGPVMANLLLSFLSNLINEKKHSFWLIMGLYILFCLAFPILLGAQLLKDKGEEIVYLVLLVLFLRGLDFIVFGLKDIFRGLRK